ncbi:MAG TPA: hypothetical protein VJ992_15315 [Gemmatimonadales bacterium]|nr:hypothetical protein [Gemmatimonadales bacterium]
MAPGLTRATAAAGLLCAAIVVAYLPPAVRTSPNAGMWSATEESMTKRHAQALDAAVRRAEVTLRLSRERDALLERMERTAGGGIFIGTAGQEGTPPTARVRAAVDSVWAALPRHDAGMRVGVKIVRMDSAPPGLDGHQVAEVWTLPPATTDGHTCIVLARLPARIPPGAWSLEYAHGSRLLGPCAYYAAFGRPGAPVARWLAHGGMRYALSANWHPVDYDIDPSTVYGGTPYNWSMGSFAFEACHRGRVARCGDMVRDVTSVNSFRLRLGAVDLSGAVRWQTSWSLGDELTPGGRYLADIVAHFGPDRFGRFWRSPADLDSGFAHAFDTPLAEWTRGWVDASYPPLPAGMLVRPRAWLTSLLCALVFVGIGVGVARRRGIG